ncbi:transposase [Paenibacillus sp. CAA11]|nr:transposase [Paenibacillus sp. CAA11]
MLEAAKEKDNDEGAATVFVEIFHTNRKADGTRKIKFKLGEQGFSNSRRRMGRIMKQ